MFQWTITMKKDQKHQTMGLAFAMLFGAALCAGTAYGEPSSTAPATNANGPATTSPVTTQPEVSVPVPVVQMPAASGKIKKHPTLAKTKKKAAISVTSFIGQINARDVNVRSGPGLSYYAIGQLARGDLIQVTGERNGWYRFAAPAGARCYIARQFVTLGADGTTGTVTGSFVNVRAASALTPASNYAVVNILNNGAHVSITGQTPTYDIIRAPKGTGFYILARFVSPAPAGSTYVTPQLKMPAGFSGSGLATGSVSAVSATPKSNSTTGGLSAPVAPVSPVVPVPTPATTQNAPTPPSSNNASATVVNMPTLPPPAASFNPNTYDAFNTLNRQMQVQFNKPILNRKLQPLLAGFENLLQRQNVPTFIRRGCIARIKLLKKQIAIQKIVAASRNQKPLTAVLAPYQQKWEQSQKELIKAQENAPYIAYGILKTSTVIKNYALMDPVTGRVVAYLEPTSKIDIAKLLGSYIGVKGEVVSRTGVVVHVIKVSTATMFPEPSATAAPK